MLPPPESPGQEKSTPHDPDIVRHYRLRIHAHVLSERKKHRLRIRCHASLRKEKTATHSFMLSSLEYPGQEKSMPHDPDTVPQHPPRIHGHVLSERTPTCYTLFVHAFFSGENGSEEKQRGITIKISEPEQEKPFVSNSSENEAQKKTPVADLFIPLNIWNGMEIREDSHERKTRAV